MSVICRDVIIGKAILKLFLTSVLNNTVSIFLKPSVGSTYKEHSSGTWLLQTELNILPDCLCMSISKLNAHFLTI